MDRTQETAGGIESTVPGIDAEEVELEPEPPDEPIDQLLDRGEGTAGGRLRGVALGQPVGGPRIVPINAMHAKRDILANGRPCFKLTQPFNAVNAAVSPLPHGALDLGNFNCGDPVVASERGQAGTLRDGAGALGVRIQHAGGVVTEYWHLSAFTIRNGETVARGQQVGRVGNTGISAGCHLHYEVKRNGARIDPWPTLPQNAKPILEDTDMKIAGKFLRRVDGNRCALALETNFRVTPDTKRSPLQRYPKGTLVPLSVVVQGEKVGAAKDAAEWYFAVLSVNGKGYMGGYLHSSGLPRTRDGMGVAMTKF